MSYDYNYKDKYRQNEKKLALENLQENKIPVNQTTHWFLLKMTREELIIVTLRKEIKTYKMGGYAKTTNIL